MIPVIINLAVNISSLFFLIFMMFVYFSKKKMNNIDNKLYTLLLIFNFLNSAFHLGWLVLQYFQVSDIDLLLLFIRGYWIPVQLYCVVLIFYLIIVLKQDSPEFMDKLNKNSKKIYLAGLLITLFVVVFDFILPVNLLFYENTYYIYFIGGLDLYFYYFFFISLLLVIIFSLIIYRNPKNKRKLIPFKFLLFFITGGFVFSFAFPAVCVTEFLLVIISYLMFHTIENPDLKLVNELTLAKDSAEKASNAKSDFLSSMSHELRTPLNAILGFSQNIESSTNLDDIHNDSKEIVMASQKLLELVDSILNINKLDDNSLELNPSNYSLRSVIDEVTKLMQFRIGEKPIELRVKVSDDLPNTLYGDKDKIKIIFNNLISNAIKYTDEGYIDFNVDCVCIKNKCTLRISINDTGRGIKDEELNNLFTKFYRRDEDKDSDIEGAGLGLAITKSLIELMGGKITVNSSEGIGTTFFVTFTEDIVSSNDINDNSEIL